MTDIKRLLKCIVDDFIDDFMCMNGRAYCYRYTAIQGIIRYAYMCEYIDCTLRDFYLKKISDTVGGFFGENVVDHFYFSL